jgi:hypothetical protein
MSPYQQRRTRQVPLLFFPQYGVFNYEKVERQDYVQGLAQPNRAGGVDWSPLYRMVLSAIAKLERIFMYWTLAAVREPS